LKSDLIIAGKELKLPIEGVSQNNNEIKIRNKSYKIINDKFNYYHTVKRYDNWYKIAKYYNVKLSQILDWNNAQKNTKLYVGNKVIIKMRKPILSSDETVNLRYVVNTGDTAAIISSGFDITPEILLKQNNIKQTRYLVAGKSLLIKK
jgi:LysM repeat protein